MKKILSAILLAASALSGMATEPTTHIFNVVDGDTLRLDVYMPAQTAEPCPAVIFAFGGGFRNGRRDGVQYRRYFDFLTDNGIAVVSTDYRTSLAKAEAQTISGPEGFAMALGGAVNDAVTDFLTATGYVLANSAELGINPMAIASSGSSAGAITVLQAEYMLANGLLPAGLFPAGWNYAGVVSFAGAIFTQGEPHWSSAPCPLMLWHGNADNTVPYRSLSAAGWTMSGSAAIAASMDGVQAPCQFYSVAGADHSVAVDPMHNNLWEILAFLRGTAFGSERSNMNATVMPVGTVTPASEAEFTTEDYLRQNLQ